MERLAKGFGTIGCRLAVALWGWFCQPGLAQPPLPGESAALRGVEDILAAESLPARPSDDVGSDFPAREFRSSGHWAQDQATAGVEPPPSAIPEAIPFGHVIWDGVYLPPPYAVTEDGEEICINGRRLPPLSLSRLAEPFRPGWRGRGGGRYGSPPGPEQESIGQRGGMNGPPARASTVVRILDGDGMVLVHGEFTHLIRSNDARYVLNVLLAERDADAAASLLGSFFQESGRGRETLDWRQVTGSFVSHAALQSRLEPAVNLDVRPDTRFGIRVLSIRYGMTLSGMVLGVFGFGMLLQHRPHARSPCASQDAEGDGFRMLPCYVVLVVIFAGFDLLCTLFADSSGGLLELNPLGSSLLQTPLLLSGVKISATLTSASILYCLRPYRIAQVTSWWMCLVCVMVTWRWVMFHSLFLS